ncbi:MAG: ATP-binding protein [Candidatus Zhuqueibacterota bacterium]
MKNTGKIHTQESSRNTTWILFIGALIIAIATLHYAIPTRMPHLHELLRAFFYLPIILAAYRFRLKGGLSAAAVVIALYFPHVVFQWGGDFLSNFSRFLAMVMFLVVGSVAGTLSRREWEERRKYRETVRELEHSYRQLKSQSEKLTEIEDQLRTAERLSVLGELTASLAHEVRNPLGSIWGVVEILKSDCFKEGKSSEFMDILINEVKRLNQVVENYLNFARKPQVTKQSCNLAFVSRSVVYLLNYKAQRQGISFALDFPASPMELVTDENQLRQILINLLLNSIYAMPDGGEITIRGEYLPSNQAEEFHWIRLTIRDTGQGMTQETLSDIFKPFFTTKPTGTGLGLKIVKRIIDQNKWKMDVKSSPSQGTDFTITIPPEKKDA